MTWKIFHELAFSSLGSEILQLLFPSQCPGCSQIINHPSPAQLGFCAGCWQTVHFVENPCPQCGLPGSGATCRGCFGARLPFKRAIAPLIYGGQVATAIQRIKYSKATYLIPALGPLLRSLLGKFSPIDSVLPVPLHRKRFFQRGFNQAALLAKECVTGANLRLVCNALHRVRDTASQAGLDKLARKKNVEGAFMASAKVYGQHLLLVDDVMTTGATAVACSAALIKAGAASVQVLTLARALP